MAATINASTSSGLVSTADNSGVLQLQSSSVAALTIDTSQNVGIGTNSPSSKLTVYDSASVVFSLDSDTGTNLRNTRYTSDASSPFLTLRKTRGTLASPTAVNSGDGIGIIQFVGYGGTNYRGLAYITGTVGTYTSDTDISAYLTFSTTPTGSITPVERMRIDSNGNVGIGTTSPSSYGKLALSISGTTGTNNIIGMYQSSAADSVALRIAGYRYTGTTQTAIDFIQNSASNFQSNIAFSTDTGAGITEKMRIDSAGNVGIGTTSPNGKLAVIGSSSATLGSLVQYSISGGQGFYFNSNSTGLLNTLAVGTGENLAFNTGSSERMRIDSSGNVGIGNTTLYGRLDVLANGNTNSVHLANIANTDTGGYLNSTGSSELMLSGGASYNSYSAPNFVMNAKATVASGMYLTGDSVRFWTNTGLTAGTTFNQTERMRIDSNGYVTNAVNGLGNGLHQAQLYYRLNSTNVGSNATGAQSVFGVGVTLIGSTQYEFETLVILTKTAGTTSHTITFGFGGTATINNILICASITDANSTLPLTPGTSTGAAATSSSLVITSALSTANRVESFLVKGTVSINAGGTFIPQYTLSAAPGGAYTTQIGSYFKISPLAASGANVNIGSWV